MKRIGQYAISLTSTLVPLCDVLQENRDPESDFQEFAEVVGNDLIGAQIEAGLPVATWKWDRLSQTDFNTLIGYIGPVYIRTRNNAGGGATTYTVYSGIMARPKGTFSEGDWLDVSVDFSQLEAIP